MGPIGGPAPRRTGRQTVGRNVTLNWTCAIALQINRPVLSSLRVPYMKNKESNYYSNKCNIWSPAPRGARHQDELADWLSVVMWLRLRLFLQDSFQYNSPTYAFVFLVVSFLLAFPPSAYMHSSSPHLCYITLPISFSLTWPFYLYLPHSISCETPHCAAFLSLLRTLFSNTLTLMSFPQSQRPSFAAV
jgi:hypothetical protein